MKKKRKVWWIAGSLLGFFLLFFITALFESSYSEDAKLEQALSEIFASYEFHEEENTSDVDYVLTTYTTSAQAAAPISQEDELKILASLKEACPSCTVEVLTEASNQYLTAPADKTTYDIHYYRPQRGGNIDFVKLYRGVPPNGTNTQAFLLVRKSPKSPSSFLKTLWPW